MDNSLESLGALLQRQVALAQAQRFRISDHPQAEIVKMLGMCYKAEVESRRSGAFLADKATEERVEKAAKWLSGNYKPGLMLYGRVGSGKSTMARAIVRLIGFLYDRYEMGDRRTSVTKCSALELSRIATDDISRIDQFKRTKMLFIDDLGVEPPVVKNWGNEFTPVVDLLYSRYDSNRFTIITSNLRGEAFRERYGDRIGDRMLEMFDTIAFEQSLSYRK